MGYVVCFALGLALGVILCWVDQNHYDGNLIVSDKNENTQQWILDVKTDPDKIPKKKDIRLKITSFNRR